MLRVLLLLGALGAVAATAASERPSVFEASPAWPAPFVERLKPAATPSGDVLRLLTVEERVGEPRDRELVRVPLFLHADEPNNPDQWAVFTIEDTARQNPLPFQVDDQRRNESGQLTRCHLYFEGSLRPWERRQFVLVRRVGQPASIGPADLSSTEAHGQVRLAGEDLAVTFLTTGPRAGAIAGITALGHGLRLPDGWIAPSLTLVRQAPDCSVQRRTELSYENPAGLNLRDLRWGSGPLFAKLTVRVGASGAPDAAEFSYLIPRHGAILRQTERIAPEGEATAEVVGAEDNLLLSGRLQLAATGDNARVVRVPAGLRRLTRATNGHFLDALVDGTTGLALLPVPAVQTGGGTIRQRGNNRIEIAGSAAFRRNRDSHSSTLRAFWGEVRYAFTNDTGAESLWHLARREYQPLVAIVDEPDLGPAECRAAMPAIAERFMEIKYWGRNWQQDAAIFWLHRDEAKFNALVARHPMARETDPRFHLPGWARTTPPGPRNPKDQGRIDPYHVSYGASLLPLLHRLQPTDRQAPTALAIGLASRQVHGRVNAEGWPYIDCFATAFNMQIGPLGLALFGGLNAKDPALAAWARDSLHAPGVTGVYGHGQRPYPGEIRNAEQSDFLYESICDFHLRSLELATGEDLWIHPAALARYFDCVDVTGDLQHRSIPDATGRSWYRANFFRGQAHDHRWENWSAGPLAGLFAHPADHGTVGSTEAAYWLTEQGLQPHPWAELIWFAHTDLLLATADQPRTLQAGPALPTGLHVARTGSATRLNWNAVPGAIGYRVYRAEHDGGPWTWLNSPYDDPASKPVTATTFADPNGSAEAHYLVTAVDAYGRESRWYADEPER